ncbi:General transcription factor IIH subunit 5 [Manis javanica]|nr:General transcription factor IIH subunit 5 [Manis javanica]
MVNVLKGVLIECDPAMKQFLLHLDESNALGKKFIIQDIDDTHVFVIAELVNVLQERKLHRFTVPETMPSFMLEPEKTCLGAVAEGGGDSAETRGEVAAATAAARGCRRRRRSGAEERGPPLRRPEVCKTPGPSSRDYEMVPEMIGKTDTLHDS